MRVFIMKVGLVLIALGAAFALLAPALAEDQPAGPATDQLTGIQKELMDRHPAVQPEPARPGELQAGMERPLRVPDEVEQFRPPQQQGPDVQDAERGLDQDRASSTSF